MSAPGVKRSQTGLTRFHRIYMFILKNLVNPVYTTVLIKYHTPNPTAPITPRITSANNVINNLNFRYRPLSGGAKELCGKYGGGV